MRPHPLLMAALFAAACDPQTVENVAESSVLTSNVVTAEVVIYALGNNAFPTQSDTFTVPAPKAPFNIAEMFSIGSNDYLFLLSSPTGYAAIFKLDDTGHYEQTIQTLDLENVGWRAAQIVRSDGQSRLFLFDPRDGHYRQYDVSDTGAVVSNTADD